jgi:hypothetical protein
MRAIANFGVEYIATILVVLSYSICFLSVISLVVHHIFIFAMESPLVISALSCNVNLVPLYCHVCGMTVKRVWICIGFTECFDMALDYTLQITVRPSPVIW